MAVAAVAVVTQPMPIKVRAGFHNLVVRVLTEQLVLLLLPTVLLPAVVQVERKPETQATGAAVWLGLLIGKRNI
jgi:hypothetical protein